MGYQYGYLLFAETIFSFAEKFIDELLSDSQPAISAITEIELLCWKTSSAQDLELIREFINDSFVIELERPIKFNTADIRKRHKVKLPDAIIAATASMYELTLLTRNVKDFQGITGLLVINPWDK